MSRKRRAADNQLELAFASADKGEALESVGQGRESLAASHIPECSAMVMQEVLGKDNLRKALKRVRANKGAAGVDGMTVDELPGHLLEHWTTIRSDVVAGRYRPRPVRVVMIPKLGGGERMLGIPTVVDRFIQQAVQQVLQSKWDRTFSDSSCGFRPGRSAHQAIARAQQYVADGYEIVVDLDLEKFFDRVNHDVLMSRVAARVDDKPLLGLIRAFLNAGMMAGGLVSQRREGTPQGSPLSPLLSNLLLDDLDRELERRGHRFVRYADDVNVYVASERAGERVMASITRFLDRRLRLKVNTSKSRVAPAMDRDSVFLSFGLTAGRYPLKRRISDAALQRFRWRVRQITCRKRGTSIEQMISELARYLVGWRGYFSFCQTPSVLQNLDSWIRRRLRCVLWKQWKTARNRYRQLRRLGVPDRLARITAAGSQKGNWRMSHTPGMTMAVSNAYLSRLGLPPLHRT